MGKSVLQDWVQFIPLMQQSVLMSAARNADMVEKRHPSKHLIRYFRRCFMLSAFDGKELLDPWESGGGSYTGPWPEDASETQVVDAFIDARDGMSLHYYAHAMHAFEILAYKHPQVDVRALWRMVYERMAHALHLWPETEDQMDRRLGDNPEGWAARNDPSTTCSD